MAGQLWIWGLNDNGQLGDNTIIDKSSPIQTIAGGNGWKWISCGNYFTTAIKSDGTLWTWGQNSNGQLGDNTTIAKSSPVQTIAGGNNWFKTSCGFLYMAAIKTDGTLWSWGYNGDGQLGDNTVIYKSSPIQTIAAGYEWTDIACGEYHAAAIKKDGTLWTWGQNGNGQLGDNTTVFKSSPVQTIAFGNSWNSVSCANNFTCAIKTDGTLWVWGLNNYGQLGDGTTTYRSSPVQVIGSTSNWHSVSCSGFGSTSAIKKDGTLWGWGLNADAQIGDNTTIRKSSPVQTIAGGNDWSTVAKAPFNTFATKTDNTLWGWGWNGYGQIGDNTTTDRSSPVQTIAGGTRWFLASSKYNTAAIYENTPNQLSINEQPQAGYNANQLLIQPVINIDDSNGAVVRIATNSVTVAVQSGTAVLSGTTTVNAVDGIATFTDLVLTGSGPVVLRFTSSGLTLTDSNTFTVSLTLPIIPKKSEVTGRIPTSGQLNIGELAINIEDKQGFIKKSDGTVLNIFNGKIADGGTF